MDLLDKKIHVILAIVMLPFIEREVSAISSEVKIGTKFIRNCLNQICSFLSLENNNK